jgi:hypothetical protein
MSDELKEELEPGAASATDEGNAGVSDRSEKEIEAGLEGAGESKDEGEGTDDILDALAEADPKRAVVGLKKRLAKLTAQRNTARAEAAQRNADAAELAAYKKRERDAKDAMEAARRRTPEAQKAEERRAAIREALDEAYGPGTSDGLDEARANVTLQREKHAQDGISYLTNELKDHGITVDESTLVRWERAVGSELQEDPELLAAFRRPSTQKRAIETAFERVRDGLANPVLKQQGAKPLARIQRNREAVLGGGTNRGALAGTPEPEVDYTTGAKGLKGRALEEYWSGVKEKEWARLAASERQA